MKTLIIAISILLLVGSVAWAEKPGNQLTENPIVISTAAIAASIAQIATPRYITSVYWYYPNNVDDIYGYFRLEDGKDNVIVKDRRHSYIHGASVVYDIHLPVRGIHCPSLSSGTILYIYTR